MISSRNPMPPPLSPKPNFPLGSSLRSRTMSATGPPVAPKPKLPLKTRSASASGPPVAPKPKFPLATRTMSASCPPVEPTPTFPLSPIVASPESSASSPRSPRPPGSPSSPLKENGSDPYEVFQKSSASTPPSPRPPGSPSYLPQENGRYSYEASPTSPGSTPPSPRPQWSPSSPPEENWRYPDEEVPEEPFYANVPEEMPVRIDPYFPSDKIMGLNWHSFYDYLSTKQKALVMFYNSQLPRAPIPEQTFVNVANRISNETHGFGAVDCSINNDLCISENACQTPMLKLYSNGYQLSSISQPDSFDAAQMAMFVKMTPVLTAPRIISSKEIEQVIEPTPCTPPKKKKKSIFPWRK